MDPHTFRGGDSDPEDPTTYWRRRVFALGGVLGVVALLAWACSGAAGKDDKKQVAQQSSRPSTAASPMATVTVTVTPTPTPSDSASASPSDSASPSGSASPSPSASPEKRGPGDPCDPHDVVVNADLGGTTYGGGKRPSFGLSVVNTGDRTCTYDVGPGALHLKVTSGSDRIWDSGDCAKGSVTKKLKRGVPVTRTVTWDRTRSKPSCHHSGQKARPGTYVVRFSGDHVKSRSHVFYLR